MVLITLILSLTYKPPKSPNKVISKLIAVVTCTRKPPSRLQWNEGFLEADRSCWCGGMPGLLRPLRREEHSHSTGTGQGPRAFPHCFIRLFRPRSFSAVRFTRSPLLRACGFKLVAKHEGKITSIFLHGWRRPSVFIILSDQSCCPPRLKSCFETTLVLMRRVVLISPAWPVVLYRTFQGPLTWSFTFFKGL